MESAAPKDEKITNQDDSITNVDEDLNKSVQPIHQDKPDDERLETVVPDNDSGKPGAPADEGSEDDDTPEAMEN